LAPDPRLQTECYVASRKWFRSRAVWIAAAALTLIVALAAFKWGRAGTHTEPSPFSDVVAALDRGAVAAVPI